MWRARGIHVLLSSHHQELCHTNRSDYAGNPVTRLGCIDEREDDSDDGELKINVDKI